MPAKPSLEPRKSTIRQTQKNGDIYVLERVIQYDPEKKYNRVLSTTLIGKIIKGEGPVVPTRPRKKSEAKVSNSKGLSPRLTASRSKVGMMDILDHVGKVSGIDDAIYANTDEGTAQKILSLARYLVASNGQTLPGIVTFQLTHPLPYEDGINEDIIHDLLSRVGLDETLQQNFFLSRCAGIHGKATLAYDSTTISTYSEQLPEARQGFNKDHDGHDTIKLLTLYSIETRQPVAFTKQPGNLPDVTSIENAIQQLSALGMKKAEIVTDNGYYSQNNLAAMLRAHFDFITLAKITIAWIHKKLKEHIDHGDFETAASICNADTTIHSTTDMMMQEFTYTRKYASHKRDLEKGTEETFTRRIYLHLYFSDMRRVEQNNRMDQDLIDLKQKLENGVAVEDLSEEAQDKVKKYFELRHYGTKVTAVFREDEIKKAKQEHGYFALVSNYEKDPAECLTTYRHREMVESFFRAEKNQADCHRTRVWGTDTLRGRLFVQFVALCYYEYFAEQIRTVKADLAKQPEDVKQSAEQLKMRNKLLVWLNNTPLYLVLQWFDTREEVKVSSKIQTKRWSEAITERDQLLLDGLGVPRR